MADEAVNSPSHYNQTELECIDAIKYALGDEGFVAYCKGNALKYTWRAGHKNNSAEDLKKAAWYCRMASGDDPRKDAGYHKQPAIVITPAATVPCGVDVPKKTFEEVYGHDFIAEAESIVPPECDTRSAEQIQKDADERELRRIDG